MKPPGPLSALGLKLLRRKRKAPKPKQVVVTKVTVKEEVVSPVANTDQLNDDARVERISPTDSVIDDMCNKLQKVASPSADEIGISL